MAMARYGLQQPYVHPTAGYAAALIHGQGYQKKRYS